MKTWKFFISVCAALLHVMYAVEHHDAKADELLTIGSPAPELDVEHWINKGQIRAGEVTQFESGKIYVIEFWATWCGPCIASMPHLAELQAKYANKGVHLISISNEELQEVEDFLDKPVRTGGNDELTYRKLTSAYALTTDPDGSAFQDYMEASGQTGIPTAFMVGKEGAIEWIGDPRDMEAPLEQVISGTWDRRAARAKILTAQTRELIKNKIGRAMRDNDSQAALDIIDQALKENADDTELVGFLSQTRIRVQVYPATRLALDGKIDDALAMLADLKKNNSQHTMDIVEVQLGVLMHGERHDDAAEVLDQIVAEENNAEKLTQMSWMIYEAAKDNQNFSMKLIASAIGAVKKAAVLAPKESAVLDTHAHLLHRSGQLDEALTIQSQAAELAGGESDDINEFLQQLKNEKDKQK